MLKISKNHMHNIRLQKLVTVYRCVSCNPFDDSDCLIYSGRTEKYERGLHETTVGSRVV